jgi:hypothetical protein
MRHSSKRRWRSAFSCKINMFLEEHGSRGPLAMGETLTAWSPSCNGSVRVERPAAALCCCVKPSITAV